MRAKKGESTRHFWATVATDSNDCLEWPYSKYNGYGYSRIIRGEGPKRIHVLAALHMIGPAPTPTSVVAHNCGNRACYNWRHLRWTEQHDNLLDRAGHGLSRSECGKQGYLSRGEVIQISDRIKRGDRKSEIARKFGCTRRLIDLIATGKRHSQLTGIQPVKKAVGE